MLELRDAWSALGATEPETMILSTQGTQQLQDMNRVHHLGSPGFAPICTSTGNTKLYHVHEDEPIATVGGDYLRFRIDGSPGQSGGPMYACPEDNDPWCSAGEPGAVYGLMAGYNSVLDRYVGPKIPGDNRTAILGILP